jgi:hypothetical protein
MMSGARPSRLLIDLVPGQRICLQGAIEDATVELVHKTGRVARLKVVAPSTVRITKSQRPEEHCDLRAEHG